MPERVHPVGVVQVGVDAEDLAETGAHVVQKGFGEAGRFAKPVASCEAAGGGGVFVGGGTVDSDVLRVGSREGAGVVDFAVHPALDEADILSCGDGDGLFAVV